MWLYCHTGCGKFALRALSQCLAREFQAMGIHVAHIIIDGLIGPPRCVIQEDSPPLFFFLIVINENKRNEDSILELESILIFGWIKLQQGRGNDDWWWRGNGPGWAGSDVLAFTCAGPESVDPRDRPSSFFLLITVEPAAGDSYPHTFLLCVLYSNSSVGPASSSYFFFAAYIHVCAFSMFLFCCLL